LSIARKFGIPVNPENHSNCLTGADIEAISAPKNNTSLSIKWFNCSNDRGRLNDAQALKITDIGISMGKSGSDVSREAADIILVNDEFVTILDAVKEGIKNCLFKISFIDYGIN
ncbi:9452_t:CDS:2, partial [Cetraspora pellucida]